MTISVGTRLGPYEILAPLGAGGMGEVYRAKDSRLGRDVAIKVLPEEFFEDEERRTRFEREARTLASLNHPGIAAIHSFDEISSPSPSSSRHLLVMELVEGEGLDQKIASGPLPLEETFSFGSQIAEALEAAHEKGIIHRDLKPANVIVTKGGRVKILDFGLAKVAASGASARADTALPTDMKTREGVVMGTVPYMSPEQVSGRPLDHRTDIFSLGVILYEMAIGQRPFQGDSSAELISSILRDTPSPLTEVKPELPHRLGRIIRRCLEKAREDRLQTAGDVLDELRALRREMDSGLTASLPERLRLAQSRSSQVTAAVTQAWRRKPVRVGVFLAPLLIVGVLFALHIWHPPLHQPLPEAKTWYDQGLVAMRAGTYYQASKRLERSIELDDRYALSHARLAETYLEINSTEKAQEEVLRAMSLAPDRSALASPDAAYLDAVAATVRRDFAAAVRYYQKIFDQAASSDKANAYVDLGRAYEKNENSDKAIDSYLEANKRDPQSPAGFLRLAVLYSRRQDSANADKAFKEAETLYQTMSNDEGRVEVLYQRGALLARNGKLPEARAQLEQVLEILKNVDNKYQLVRAQLQLSFVLRNEGNLDGAKDLAAKAINLAQTSNIKNIATQGLIDVGLALMSRGDFDETGKYLRQALDLARQDKARSSEVRAILSLGRLNQQLGNNDEAISQLEEALKFYKLGGYLKETSIALTVLGRAHQDKGENTTALKYFEEQLQLSRESGDQASLGDSHMNLALLRGVGQEMYPEALGHLDEKVKIDEAQGAKIQLGFDHVNRGTFLWQLGKYPEARAALDRAFEIANQPGANYKAALAWVHLNRAQMALSERNYPDAKKNAQLALDVSASQFPDVTLQAKYCTGRAEAFWGSPQVGRKLCEEAVAMAKQVAAPQLISSALLALAEVLLIATDSKGALKTALEVQEMLAQSGQQDSQWRALLIAARASELAGNKSAAWGYASQADSLCSGLEQKWGKEAYEGYLRRPDIQNYRSQIVQILKQQRK
jgi:serine/threonine protein kinase/tetratricopeptide (TPR) repeat protein